MKLLLSNILFFLFFNSIFGHVLLNYPQGGESFVAGSTIMIEWEVLVYHGAGSFDLLYSDDGGVTWEEIITGVSENDTTYNWVIPNMESTESRIKVVQVNSGQNYSFSSTNFTISTTTNIEETDNLPYAFKLSNPYPNPFNSRSVISFELPSKGRVQLVIYDIAGRKIGTLIDDVRSEGKYSYNWDASGLSSGTYLAILKTASAMESKKIILLK